MSSYLWIEKKGGQVVKAERRHDDGTVESFTEPPKMTKFGPEGGYWQLSASNGFVGTKADLQKQQALDAKLGTTIDWVPTTTKNGKTAYKAGFTSASQKRAWMKQRCRVDLDASYRDPCPGDFRRNLPMEQ